MRALGATLALALLASLTTAACGGGTTPAPPTAPVTAPEGLIVCDGDSLTRGLRSSARLQLPGSSHGAPARHAAQGQLGRQRPALERHARRRPTGARPVSKTAVGPLARLAGCLLLGCGGGTKCSGLGGLIPTHACGPRTKTNPCPPSPPPEPVQTESASGPRPRERSRTCAASPTVAARAVRRSASGPRACRTRAWSCFRCCSPAWRRR